MHRRLARHAPPPQEPTSRSELPDRTVKNYFVADGSESNGSATRTTSDVGGATAAARKRPMLTREEFDRLQQWLACMRMLCDTPAFSIPTCRICPKLEELEGVLADLLDEPNCKIIVFSEWVRMLELVGELAREMDLDVAWHTRLGAPAAPPGGDRRFKEDPACRLFLSTDSGSLGLNLQVASAVVNLDLPWNPARLEQRIARAWRKHQTSSVRGDQPGHREVHRAPDAAGPRQQAGAGRRCARRLGRSSRSRCRPAGPP